MTNDDLPTLLHTLETAAARNQRLFFWSQRAELAALVLSAAAFEIGWTRNDVRFGGLIGALLVATALISRSWRHRADYEERWSRHRSDAESAKSLAWQYSVAGGEFPDRIDSSLAATRFSKSLETLVPQATGHQPSERYQPTPQMQAARSDTFVNRRRLYTRDRLLDQQGWYTRQAQKNQRRASQWGTLITAAEAFGLLLALGYGLNLLDLNLSGLLGTATTAAFAWQQARRYRFLAITYGSMIHQIDEAMTKTRRPDAQGSWGEIIAETEDVLCRENRRWTDDRILR